MIIWQVSDIFFNTVNLGALTIVDEKVPAALVTRVKILLKLFQRSIFEAYRKNPLNTQQIRNHRSLTSIRGSILPPIKHSTANHPLSMMTSSWPTEMAILKRSCRWKQLMTQHGPAYEI